MRERGLLLRGVGAVLGTIALAVLCALGLTTQVESPWLRVLVVAGLAAGGSLHGTAVVVVVFRLADPPRRALDEVGSDPRTHDLRPASGTMRGGTAIGHVERIATVLALAAGQPGILAAVVAVKAVGRFGELTGAGEGAAARMRERFLVGSLTSLTVAGAWGLAAALLVG